MYYIERFIIINSNSSALKGSLFSLNGLWIIFLNGFSSKDDAARMKNNQIKQNAPVQI